MNDPQVLSAPTQSLPSLSPALEPKIVREEPATPVIRPKKKSFTTYDRIMESIAHVTTLGGAAALWWVGAQFTLAFLVMIGMPIHQLSYAQWLIPAGITAIEIKYWPHKGLNRNLIAMFLIIAGIDLTTTLIGGQAWLEGRVIGAFTIPDSGWLWVIAGVAACFSAFWPEKLARAAIGELRKIWNI
ncbi:hypothetical protein [Herpetosiphon llansteffanensis]|uniref:hypothetical protein n=1 Tax=Herpetosiphon llansteffanensis TaxID=2094568 RepID=UPI000F51AA35|nr:hypothetical protein [Herpetosiphon llansteffanensis]